jgi:ATP-dependent exoDNAse (exonuclease V) beta subunit
MKVFQHQTVDLGFTITHEDTDAGRFYTTPSGIRYPSVTTVLKAHTSDAIDAWRKRVGDDEANRVMLRASTRGTAFHDNAERYMRNDTASPKNHLERHMLHAAKKFLDRIDNIRLLEAGLYSKHLRLAGRVDCIAEFDGVLSIIDFKTSKEIKSEDRVQHYYMQASAYAIMWEELTGQPITRLVIPMVADTGETMVFTSQRDKHTKDLLKYRNLFEQLYNG